jgi:hypothetical protein
VFSVATTNPNPASEPAAVHDSAPPGAVTVFTNRQGCPLSKSATLDSEGRLEITPSAQLSQGSFRVASAANVTELAQVISTLTTSQALGHGVPRTGALSGRVVSEAKWESNPDALTRSLECFGWGSGPGWLMVDADLKDLPPGTAGEVELSTLEEIRAVLCAAVPELATVPMLGLPSASAMLYRVSDGEPLRGLTGARFYVPVAHAEDIPALGKRLFDRLVLAGLGYAFVAKSGGVFVRTLIDSAVWSPERLDFIGGAACGDGVEQRRGDPIIWNSNSSEPFFLDALRPEELSRLAEITRQLVAERCEEATATRKAYEEVRAAAGHPIVAKQGEGALIRLAPEHAIQLVDGTWITVADILADPEKYHGQVCNDPIEHDYPSQQVAKIYAKDQRSGPVINSFAHGGQKYALDRGGPVPHAAEDFEALASAPKPASPIIPLLSEGERLASITGDAEAAFLAELPGIRGDLLSRWEILKAATSYPDPLSDVFGSVVWPEAVAASSRSEAAFRFSLTQNLAGHAVWSGLSDSDRQLLVRATRMLLKKGASDVRAPQLIEKVPPREWLIEELFPVGSVVALIGPTNQGKTFASLSIACLVASPEGSPLSFDGRAVRKHGPVFYFTSEDPQGLALRREAWEKANGAAPRLYLFDDVPLLTGPLEDSIRCLRSAADQAGTDPALLVIDVFTDAVIGDDNSAEVIAPAMRHARVLGRMFGASVLLVHHSNKSDPRDPRGSSAFGNATDVTCAVIMDAAGIHMTWVKARSTPKGRDFHFHIRNGVLLNGPSLSVGESGTLTEGETLAQVAGRELQRIETPATSADWGAAIMEAVPSSFGEKVTPHYRRTKLSRARKLALDNGWARKERNKYIVGPEPVPEDAMEPGSLVDVSPVEALI